MYRVILQINVILTNMITAFMLNSDNFSFLFYTCLELRGWRTRPVNPAGFVYRQRLRAREPGAVQQEVIRPRRNRNPRNIQPVQAD
jgi:hypothetical protein